MNKLALALGPLLIVVGAYLLYRGHQVSQSFGGQVSEALTGEPTDRTMQYYLAGGACIALGAAAGGFGFLKKG